MNFRLGRFFLDEKDLFVALLGAVMLVSLIMDLDLSPFRRESLVVFFVFLAVVRSLLPREKAAGYTAIVVLGLLFSLFLSPYGVAIYLACATFLFLKLR
jgi:hypothetical protein